MLCQSTHSWKGGETGALASLVSEDGQFNTDWQSLQVVRPQVLPVNSLCFEFLLTHTKKEIHYE